MTDSSEYDPLPKLQAFYRIDARHPGLHRRIFKELEGNPGLTAAELHPIAPDSSLAEFEAYLDSLVKWRPPSGKLPRIRAVGSEWGLLFAMDSATPRVAMLAAFNRRDQSIARIICFMRKHLAPMSLDTIQHGAGLQSYSQQGVRNLLDVLLARQALERRGLAADGSHSLRDRSYVLTDDMRRLANDPLFEKFQLELCSGPRN